MLCLPRMVGKFSSRVRLYTSFPTYGGQLKHNRCILGERTACRHCRSLDCCLPSIHGRRVLSAPGPKGSRAGQVRLERFRLLRHVLTDTLLSFLFRPILDGLRNVGFKLSTGTKGSGFFLSAVTRGGGYYIGGCSPFHGDDLELLCATSQTSVHPNS